MSILTSSLALETKNPILDLQYDEDEYDDDEDDEEYDDEDDVAQDEPKKALRKEDTGADFFGFGKSLTVKGESSSPIPRDPDHLVPSLSRARAELISFPVSPSFPLPSFASPFRLLPFLIPSHTPPLTTRRHSHRRGRSTQE